MSCNIVRLCGITSRFQLLSPSTRQVTHALLTRPPLSHKQLQSEEICRKCFVRLACVKHAASVHPEPGSNSYVKVFVPSQFFWLTPVFLNRQKLVHYLVSLRCLFALRKPLHSSPLSASRNLRSHGRAL